MKATSSPADSAPAPSPPAEPVVKPRAKPSVLWRVGRVAVNAGVGALAGASGSPLAVSTLTYGGLFAVEGGVAAHRFLRRKLKPGREEDPGRKELKEKLVGLGTAGMAVLGGGIGVAQGVLVGIVAGAHGPIAGAVAGGLLGGGLGLLGDLV